MHHDWGVLDYHNCHQITSASEFVSVLREDNNTLTTLDLSGNTVPVSDLSDIDLLTRLNARMFPAPMHLLQVLEVMPISFEISRKQPQNAGRLPKQTEGCKIHYDSVNNAS